ncbi:MAG: hypothetical protein E6J60_16060 [Deltaproteobacteria bacterium]|nr:MAG: hypothetical protein E6J60_16060 [Deltaproteobacteria bacterium]
MPTVPRFNLWTLWWNSDRLLHGYRGYWQAPIFYPAPHSFAFSEPLWLTGLVASPFLWISGSPALAYNAVLLLTFALNGWCGYFLLRRLHIRWWPAVCGGLIIEMLPIVADQLGVLQSTVLFPIPMTLACLIRFGRTGRVWPALGSALWMAVCYHTSSNTALLFGPVALVGLLVFAGRRLFRLRAVIALGLAALSAGLLIAPIAIVQSRVLKEVEPYRADWMIAATSAHPITYSKMPATNLLRRRPPDRKVATLYPGTGVPAGLSTRYWQLSLACFSPLARWPETTGLVLSCASRTSCSWRTIPAFGSPAICGGLAHWRNVSWPR